VRTGVPEGNRFPLGVTLISYTAGSRTVTQRVTVTNTPPEVALSSAEYTVAEGTVVTLNASASDAESTPEIAWYVEGDPLPDGTGSHFSYSGADGPAVVSVSARATDACGALTDATTIIRILNSPPVVTAFSMSSAVTPVGASVGAFGSFADASPIDTHTAVIDWGDDTVSSAAVELRSFAASHAYTSAGVYTARVTISDDDGATATESYRYVVVYDPAAGFVTGGGWIVSPAGALATSEAASGKATFGFQSKYRNGTEKPSGNAEFAFTAGSFRFISTDHDWLVVAGARAQFKGSGRVNGAGDYGFMLTAVDGDLSGNATADKFRLKVWDKASGAVIYDNNRGAADDASPTTALGGGSIVVHRE
jgi:hypothetical protein